MPFSPYIIAGHCYQSDGSTVQAGAVVFVYNKTKDEIHHGNDPLFPDLITNSNGEYLVNLANYTTGWTEGDEVHISAYYEDTAQHRRLILPAGGSIDNNLTLKDLEPAVALQKMLRIYLTDPNSTRNNSNLMVKNKFDRDKLTKSDYPIITLVDVDEESSIAGITNTNQAEVRMHTILITVYIWSKVNDAQILTINESTYEGTKLRDYLARQIAETLRQEFYRRPSYNKNAVIQKYYDYEKERMESLDFDEETDHGIMMKELNIIIKTIAQTS